MTDSEMRIIQLETRLIRSEYNTQQLQQKVTALQQQARQAGGGGFGGGGGTAAAYWSSPSSAVGPGASLPTETVYQTAGGVDTALAGTYAIYNRLGSGLVATNKAVVEPDGAGGFLYVTQGCA